MLVTVRLGGHTGRLRRARAFRQAIEDLGGLWYKAGQLIGLRRDIFPAEFCDELSRLQDLADGFDTPALRSVFAEEFGRQPEDLFARFDLAPVAAGSVGAVHVAITRSGAKVAVKVQRPYVDRLFRSDLRYIRLVVAVVVRLNWLPYGRWKEMLWELERMMETELDYRFEASNLRRMRKTLCNHKVIVPAVHPRFTTRRVLVMEYIDGVFLSDFIRAATTDPRALAAWCDRNDVDPARVGWRLYQTHTRQVYVDNLFHSDLHPGNVVLLRGSRLALIDFGSIGSIDAAKLRKYYMIFRAVGEGDFNKVADLFLLLTAGLPDIDTEPVKAAIVRVMRTWEARTAVRDLPYHEKSLSHAMNEIAKVFRDYRIPISWELMRVNRAEVTLDYSLMYLLPHANYHKLIQRFERKIRRQAIRQMFDADDLQDRILDLAAASRVVPQYLSENLQLDAEWVRRRAMSFEQQLGAGAFAGRMVVSLLLTATTVLGVTISFAYLDRWLPSWLGQRATEVTEALVPWLPRQDDFVWLLVIAALIYLFRRLRSLRRRIG